MLATCKVLPADLGTAREAVDLAEFALSLSGDDTPGVLDTLAAAYARNGTFRQAVTAAKRGARTARAQGDERLAEDLAAHLSLYEAGLAFTA